MNAVTIPINVQEPEKKSARKAWKPGAKDELIYRWVKFEGKRQTWVASALGISQPTVSRVIERYERWQAHAEPGEAGRVNAEERRRAQRWATYERNEVIMQSALRLAYELEGFVDVSKTTTRRKQLIGQELESTSTSAVLDRSGTCCRFLRLAFRVNMEQLKLAELEPLEQLEPAEVEEIAEIDRDPDTLWNRPADATEEELRSAYFHWGPPEGESGDEDRGQKTEDREPEPVARGQEPVAREAQMTNDHGPMTNDGQSLSEADLNNLNNLNNAGRLENRASDEVARSCGDSGEAAELAATVFTPGPGSHAATNGAASGEAAADRGYRRKGSSRTPNAPRARIAPRSDGQCRRVAATMLAPVSTGSA